MNILIDCIMHYKYMILKIMDVIVKYNYWFNYSFLKKIFIIKPKRLL